MTDNSFTLKWHSGHRKAQCAPNPAYPNGIDLDIGGPGPACVASIPYPSPEVGAWEVTCLRCGYIAAVTAAGRPDDPKSVRLPCKPVGNA